VTPVSALTPSTRARLCACLIETQMASTGWRKSKASPRRRFVRR
jgi:hypothetical protein